MAHFYVVRQKVDKTKDAKSPFIMEYRSLVAGSRQEN